MNKFKILFLSFLFWRWRCFLPNEFIPWKRNFHVNSKLILWMILLPSLMIFEVAWREKCPHSELFWSVFSPHSDLILSSVAWCCLLYAKYLFTKNVCGKTCFVRHHCLCCPLVCSLVYSLMTIPYWLINNWLPISFTGDHFP